MSFEKLGLKKAIISTLTKLQFKEPTLVQKKIVPLALQKKNVVFTSPTGSGKTLAYTLGFLSRINPKQALQMVVVTPTRELCIQVSKEIMRICAPLNISVGAIYGGRDIKGDYKTTSKKNQILVVTPGRFIKHINSKIIAVGEVKFLVYDESDQMFDHGFYDDCVYIMNRVSKDTQIILSSATITSKVDEFIHYHIADYELLHIDKYIPDHIIQEKLYCTIPEKQEILLKYIQSKAKEQIMIFCNTKIRCAEVTNFLQKAKLKARTLTGNADQIERNNNLNLFRNAKFHILVTTDVAARGLHMDNVKHVINYDVPTREEFYVHRIGRTGRSSKLGSSLTLICPEDKDRFDVIQDKYELNIKEVNI